MNFQTVFAILLLGAACCDAYVSHGDPCDQSNIDTSCHPSENLACRGGRCECINTDDMEWDVNRGVCVVLVGGSCYKAQYTNYPCVAAANCQYATKQCVCSYQHSPTQARHCSASHGSRCNASIECNSNDLLVCAFDSCRCPNPLNHVFREGRNRCFIKAEASCNPNPGPNDVTCDPESNECMPDPQSATGYSCQCKTGMHIEHYERQCVRGHMMDCKDASGDLTPPCDYVGGLHCYENKCQCYLSPDQAWDPVQNMCASLEGRGCALQDGDKYPYPWFDAEYFFHCFTGLECMTLPHDEHHMYEGICRRPADKNATVEIMTYK